MKKVVAYCRVSTDSEDQNNSLQNQKAYFERHINDNEEWSLTRIYADEGITGTSTKKRKQFNQMIRDAENGKIDIILTKEVSRFARNTVDALQYTRKLKAMGIEVYFLLDNISTADKDGELRLTIMSSLAQEEARKISERCTWGAKRSMEKGVVFGNVVLGYYLENGKITGINPKEAEIVKSIFHKYLYEEKGFFTIGRELMEKGIKTSRGNSKWYATTIKQILTNEKYCGDLKQGKTYIPNYLDKKTKKNKGEREFVTIKNHHEPIISREDFEKVQEEIKRRHRETVKDDNKRRHSSKYAFSGKLICANCGRSFGVGATKTLQTGEIRRQYRCRTRVDNGITTINENGETFGCNADIVYEDVLQECLKQLIKQIAKDKEQIINTVQQLVENVINKREKKELKENTTLKRKEAILKERDKAIELCIKGLITEEELERKKEEKQEELKQIERELLEQQEELKAIENKNEIIEKSKQLITDIINTKVFSDEVCRTLVDKIIVHNKAEFDFYLKGNAGDYFSKSAGVLLYNYHGKILNV